MGDEKVELPRTGSEGEVRLKRKRRVKIDGIREKPIDQEWPLFFLSFYQVKGNGWVVVEEVIRR